MAYPLSLRVIALPVACINATSTADNRERSALSHWHAWHAGAHLLRAYFWMRPGPQGPSVLMTEPGVAPASHSARDSRNICPRTDQGLSAQLGSRLGPASCGCIGTDSVSYSALNPCRGPKNAFLHRTPPGSHPTMLHAEVNVQT